MTLLGVGESSDAHHISTPDPKGLGAEIALRAALSDAGLSPRDIGYVNLHATGTAKNDEMESLVLARFFPEGVPASGTKPMTGHTLGAAGATKLGFCWMALSGLIRNLSPHVWDGQADPMLPWMDLVGRGRVLSRADDGRRYCMSNSFAFRVSKARLIIGDREAAS